MYTRMTLRRKERRVALDVVDKIRHTIIDTPALWANARRTAESKTPRVHTFVFVRISASTRFMWSTRDLRNNIEDQRCALGS